MPITQEEFDRLPALVSLRTFMQFSGLSKEIVTDMRIRGDLKAWRPPGHRKAKYPKSELGRLCGFVSH
jgi:hypothetical protein